MIVGSITVVRLLGAPNARAGASRTPFGATRSLLLGPAAVPEALPLGSLHSSPWLEESAAAAGRSILAEPTSAGGRDTTSSKKALVIDGWALVRVLGYRRHVETTRHKLLWLIALWLYTQMLEST